MADADYIDSYFKKELSPEGISLFEKRIETDPAFAEEVAFYCNAMGMIKDQVAREKKQRFRTLYNQQQDNIIQKTPVRRMWWPYVAAAAVIAALVVGVFMFNTASPQQLADSYINEELRTLPVDMDTKQDSMKTGANFYNQKEFAASLKIYENLALAGKNNTDAKFYAGIVSLQLKEYDKALRYFEELENYPGLARNPGKFYKAVTLMKRSHPGDKELAKQLLIEVDKQGLAGKKEAEEWLKKM